MLYAVSVVSHQVGLRFLELAQISVGYTHLIITFVQSGLATDLLDVYFIEPLSFVVDLNDFCGNPPLLKDL